MAGGHAAGGSVALARLIDEYGEAIYADLHRFCGGLNLVSALRTGSGYSPRQILALVRNLPLESSTVAEMRGGDEYRGWDLDRYFLASLVDSVRENTHVLLSVNSKKKVTAPDPVFRPENKTEPKKKTNMFAIMASQRLSAARKAKARAARGE